ncbi:MAG: hypothetical protein J6R54_02045 [Bacteroidaceae bacterium]|nr:hypothetical protein [Bacteroidaceae bacterium]
MITQAVTVTERSTQNIIIGRRGTYNTEQVVFDVSYLTQTYGSGSAVLMVKRPVDQTAYPATTTQDGDSVTWVITATDTSYKGHGECELFWFVDNALAKSVIYTIAVLRDIGETTEEAPDPYETWVDTLTDLGAETLQNAQAAETAQGLAEDAQTAAETAQGLAEDAQAAAESAAESIQESADQIWQNASDIEDLRQSISTGGLIFYDRGNGQVVIAKINE